MPLLLQTCFLAALVSCTTYPASAVRHGVGEARRRAFLPQPDSDKEEVVCPWRASNDNVAGEERAARTSDVVFRQGSTIVLDAKETVDGEDGLSRYMLFKRPDGHCHEESMVRCMGEKGASGASPPSSLGAAACGSRVCRPRADLPLSYTRSMVAGALTTVPQASKALLIGVGGGLIPLWVQEARPKLQLDAVDVASEVLNAAPCFGLPAVDGSGSGANVGAVNVSFLQRKGPALATTGSSMMSNVRLLLEDGRKFLQQQPPQTYDLVLVDAFTPKDVIPPCLSTLEFMNEVKAHLKPGGVSVWNVWRKERSALLNTLATAFSELAIGGAPGEGNILVLASNSPLRLEQQQRPGGGANHEEEEKTVGSWFRAAGFRRYGKLLHLLSSSQAVSSSSFTTRQRSDDDDEDAAHDRMILAAARNRRRPRRDAEWCPEQQPDHDDAARS